LYVYIYNPAITIHVAEATTHSADAKGNKTIGSHKYHRAYAQRGSQMILPQVHLRNA
jgi:hypothetical protein